VRGVISDVGLSEVAVYLWYHLYVQIAVYIYMSSDLLLQILCACRPTVTM